MVKDAERQGFVQPETLKEVDPETVRDPEFRGNVQPETPSNQAPRPLFVADADGNIFLTSLNADSAVSQEQKGNDTRETIMNRPKRKVQRETPFCEALEPQFIANTIGNIVQNLFNTDNSRDGFGTPGLRAHPLRMKYMYVEMGEIDLMKTPERSEPRKSWSTREGGPQGNPALKSVESPGKARETAADSQRNDKTSDSDRKRNDYVDDTELD